MTDDVDADFEHLYHEEYPAIAREAYLLLGNGDAASDVAQEAFMRAYERWDKISGYDRPGAWVRRVAIRLATRTLRRQETLKRILGRLVRSGGAGNTGPLDLDVVGAVRELPPSQRAAVVLHYFDGLPVTEVAEAMSCTDGTVKRHLYRARSRLRELLGEEAEDVPR